MPDWEAIERDFHAGQSLRVLAARYGIPKSTIHKHFNAPVKKDGYVDMGGTDGGQSVDSGQAFLPLSTEDIGTLTRRLIDQLSLIAKESLTLKEHALLANALSQYNKVMLTAPQEQQHRGTDWSIFTEEELAIIQPIFARAEERARINAGETGIPQLGNRKQG